MNCRTIKGTLVTPLAAHEADNWHVPKGAFTTMGLVIFAAFTLFMAVVGIATTLGNAAICAYALAWLGLAVLVCDDLRGTL